MSGPGESASNLRHSVLGEGCPGWSWGSTPAEMPHDAGGVAGRQEHWAGHGAAPEPQDKPRPGAGPLQARPTPRAHGFLQNSLSGSPTQKEARPPCFLFRDPTFPHCLEEDPFSVPRGRGPENPSGRHPRPPPTALLLPDGKETHGRVFKARNKV